MDWAGDHMDSLFYGNVSAFKSLYQAYESLKKVQKIKEMKTKLIIKLNVPVKQKLKRAVIKMLLAQSKEINKIKYN